MPLPLIENGKTLTEPLNASHGFYLPPMTTFGNLTLKLFRIIQRLDHINQRIEDLNSWFNRRNEHFIKGKLLLNLEVTDDLCLGDEIVFWLKRTTDEFISLLFLKKYWLKNNKSFPNKILIDNIGSVLKGNTMYAKELRKDLSHHLKFLERLNNIANAHKHSFISTDMVVTSAKEPQIFALDLHRNDLKNPSKFYFLPVREVIDGFNFFYRKVLNELKEWSSLSLK